VWNTACHVVPDPPEGRCIGCAVLMSFCDRRLSATVLVCHNRDAPKTEPRPVTLCVCGLPQDRGAAPNTWFGRKTSAGSASIAVGEAECSSPPTFVPSERITADRAPSIILRGLCGLVVNYLPV
jgi:hypothetical protein